MKRDELERSGAVGTAISAASSALSIVAAIALGACSPEPVVIGYLGVLSGRQSDLGVSGRNGAQLAVEFRDAAGGIRGRRIVFEAADDKQDAEAARAGFAELRRKGASAIVGPMTSDMALAVKPLADENRLLLVSPTASSPLLSGMDDYFIRVNPVDVSEGRDLAAYIRQGGARSAAIVLDLSNRSFSEGTEASVRRSLEGSGISLGRIDIDSKAGFAPSAVAASASALAAGPNDALILVAGAVDAAAICQALRLSSFKGAVYATGWAMTDDFIRLAGESAEGVSFSHYFDRNSQAADWTAFAAAYRKRFGGEPDFIAGLAANAATVIMDSLDREPDARRLKETVLSLRSFDGFQGRIEFDPFGECDLERFRLTVRNGVLSATR